MRMVLLYQSRPALYQRTCVCHMTLSRYFRDPPTTTPPCAHSSLRTHKSFAPSNKATTCNQPNDSTQTLPTDQPTNRPTHQPTNRPTDQPTNTKLRQHRQVRGHGQNYNAWPHICFRPKKCHIHVGGRQRIGSHARCRNISRVLTSSMTHHTPMPRHHLRLVASR